MEKELYQKKKVIKHSQENIFRSVAITYVVEIMFQETKRKKVSNCNLKLIFYQMVAASFLYHHDLNKQLVIKKKTYVDHS